MTQHEEKGLRTCLEPFSFLEVSYSTENRTHVALAQIKTKVNKPRITVQSNAYLHLEVPLCLWIYSRICVHRVA